MVTTISAIRKTPVTRSTAPSNATARHQTARARSIQTLRIGKPRRLSAAKHERRRLLHRLDLGVKAGRPDAFLLHGLDAGEGLLREGSLVDTITLAPSASIFL